MKCQICKEHEANVHFKQVVNGTAQELFICEHCAADNGLDVHSPMSMTDFLFGMNPSDARLQKGPDKDCPVCRMSLAEFRKVSRLGCAACYEAFSAELDPQLATMHDGTRHVGKAPAGERITAEMEALQKALEAAVERQDFEEAAKLRDTIHELKRQAPQLQPAAGSALR